MKTFIIMFGFSLAIAASFPNDETKKANAVSEQVQGLYVFIYSKPSSEYEYLGTVNPSIVPSKNAKSVIPFLIKKGKDKFPTANGIIFTNEDLTTADLIKLK